MKGIAFRISWVLSIFFVLNISSASDILVIHSDADSASDSIRQYDANGRLIREEALPRSHRAMATVMLPRDRNFLTYLRHLDSSTGIYEVDPSADITEAVLEPYHGTWLDQDIAGNLYGTSGSDDDPYPIKRWHPNGDLSLELTLPGLQHFQSVTAHRDGRIFSVGSRRNEDLEDHKELNTFSPDGEWLHSHRFVNFFAGDATYDPSEDRLYIASHGGEIKRFNVFESEPRLEAEFVVPFMENGLLHLHVDPYTNRILASGTQGTVEVLKSGELVQFYPIGTTLGALPMTALLSQSDVNGDFQFDVDDIDAIVANVHSGNHAPEYDLTGDGFVNHEDIDQWLIDAGTINQSSQSPFLAADANLDGSVDIHDFNLWNQHRFTQQTGWSKGDFNADGAVDVSDFSIWNENRFQQSLIPVPEPAHSPFLLITIAAYLWAAGRRSEFFQDVDFTGRIIRIKRI